MKRISTVQLRSSHRLSSGISNTRQVRPEELMCKNPSWYFLASPIQLFLLMCSPSNYLLWGLETRELLFCEHLSIIYSFRCVASREQQLLSV